MGWIKDRKIKKRIEYARKRHEELNKEYYAQFGPERYWGDGSRVGTPGGKQNLGPWRLPPESK